jgi:DinB family protein
MRKSVVFVLFVMFLAVPLLFAQNAQAQQSAPTVTQSADRSLSGVEGEFVPLAEAMPDDKFDYAPTNGEFKGVRNFGQQITHVAATNYMIGAALLGEKIPVDIGKGENGPDLKTKAEKIKFMKDSYAYVHKAFATVNKDNIDGQVENPFGGKNKPTRLGLVILTVGHSFDHYGQCVEYLRANGIIPPASRGQ